jgi:hypothetical protein
MREIRAQFLRLAGLFHKERRDAELAAEIESHLQMHKEDNLRSGMSPEEARCHAVIKLGGVESTKEDYRDRRGLPVLETLMQDLRFGFRSLRKNPGFCSVHCDIGVGHRCEHWNFYRSLRCAVAPATLSGWWTTRGARSTGDSSSCFERSNKFYIPVKQGGFRGGLVVRTAVDPVGMIGLIRKKRSPISIHRSR